MNRTSFFIFLLMGLIFGSCKNPSTRETNGKETHNFKELLSKGREASEATQKTLLHNVGAAMKEGGPVYAISYCNVKALPLTDSLGRELNAEISRIALKYRNPANKPATSMDEKILRNFESIDNPSLPLDTVIYTSVGATYYKAIFVGMETCLQCHGVPEKNIAPETMQKITELYPEDKATGFSLHDFRGAWKITFK